MTLGEIYMLATLAVTALCWLAKMLDQGADEVFTAALVILFLSSVTQLVRTYVGHPYSLAAHPIGDAICVVLFSGAYIANRTRWAAALVVVFITLLFLHVGFWLAGDLSIPAQRLYIGKLNALFTVALMTLTAAGGGYVVCHRHHVLGLFGDRALVRTSGSR